MWMIKAAIVIFVLLFAAAVSVYSVENLLRGRGEISNYLKNDWHFSDTVYIVDPRDHPSEWAL